VTDRRPARATTHRIPGILVAGLLVVVAAIAVSLGQPMLSTASSSPAGSSSQRSSSRPSAASRVPVLRSQPPGELGEADGLLDDGTTVFDDAIPAIANLDPDLVGALRRAAADAAAQDVEMFVTSGWRSRTYQERLLRDAISTYGSRKEAARWVATPGTSPHVTGNAVDIGPADATTWLSKHGAEYGLCQIYRNEPWHYELRRGAVDHGCPRMYADPTRDPRMQQ
jgi:D-alanyl-D-alanine carboxypeptidase